MKPLLADLLAMFAFRDAALSASAFRLKFSPDGRYTLEGV
jgi:hypothetical protein